MSKKVYVALSTFAKEGPAPLDLLVQSALSFDVNRSGQRLSKDEVIKELAGYEGVVAGLEPYDKDVLNQLPHLKCISRCGVGIDNVDMDVAKSKGIVVLNTPQVVITPVAEMTLALIFDCLRHVTAQTVLMRSGKWERKVGSQLAGKTVGIIGLGRIGKRVAVLLKHLGAHVVGVDMHWDDAWASSNAIEHVALEELFKRSDIISLHLSGGSFCLTITEMNMMKRGVMIVNTSRGQFINEQDLQQSLVSGQVGAAALDVFNQEPYQGPLIQFPNVILTPHCSTLTTESRLEMEIESVTNIITFFKNNH